MRRVMVVPPDPWRWREAFEAEAARLLTVFGENLIEVHHIGSTAVPGLAAKPIVDMLPEVRDIALVDDMSAGISTLGYRAWGEYGLPGRRYFSRDEDGKRTHNIHVYQTGDPEVKRHLAFRDYMVVHPHEARAYGDLKESLARRFPADFEAYMDGKEAFVRERERLALAWRRTEEERA